MSTPANTENSVALDRESGGDVALSPTRPFVWSVRREIWEVRSLYMAPLAVAGVVLLGYLFLLLRVQSQLSKVAALAPQKQHALLAQPYDLATAAMMVTSLIVGVFYCLGALGNERRDRSILFWKSLPVSDLTTILSKAFIPIVVLPSIVFAVTLATQLLMLVLGSAVLIAAGNSAAALWTQWPVMRAAAGLLYMIAGTALWYAPIYAWLLLVSSRAPRMPILWAVLPPLALGIIETIGFGTSNVARLIAYRITGFVHEGFAAPAHAGQTVDQLSPWTADRLLLSPGLWLGLLVAAAFLGAATWFRRTRDPG